MDLSSCVYETEGLLLNLTTQKLLPKTASEVELRQHFFLQGQEKEAIEHVLFTNKHPELLSLKITPTWMCNLRCKHCFVLDKLTKDQASTLDVDGMMIFVKNFCDRFQDTVKGIYVCLVGGEVTLQVDKCLELTEAITHFCEQRGLVFELGMTTNGTVLDVKVLELMNRCRVVTVSVDGYEDAHNWQRVALADNLKNQNLYHLVVNNIKKLIKVGLRDKVAVQASLQDRFMTSDNVRRFYEEMLRIGVLQHNIRVGVVTPTEHVQIGASFRSYLAKGIFSRPCCKYRVGTEYVIDENNMLYCDYFQNTGYLGKLADPVDQLIQAHEVVVRQTMPVLTDAKCLVCPVIGACWGRCANLSMIHKPSEVCDQQGLLAEVKQKAMDGKLLTDLRLKDICNG